MATYTSTFGQIDHVPPEFDYSTFPESDGEPMAETLANATQMIDLQWALHELFVRQGRPEVSVGGNQLMYYNRRSGWDHVSPDVYVIFSHRGAPPPSWKTWEHGNTFPDIVFEISSESTVETDLGPKYKDKPALYKRLGVKEYIIYDPQGEIEPPLQAYGWDEEGEWVKRDLLPDGGLWSPLLQAELHALPLAESVYRPMGVWLRIIDPVTGEPIPLADEKVQQEQQARIAEQVAHQLAEDRANAEEQARLAAEGRANMEEQARLAAEERARKAEAALQELQALLAERGE